MNNLLSSLPLLQAAPNPTGSMMTTILMFGGMAAIFYFMMIRPQNKKRKETQKMLEAMRKGDKVVTIGGIHGTISAVKDRTVVVKVDDSAKIEFLKSAIATVDTRTDEAEVSS